MSSPRKFAEKIALIQQKQAEGDAAFNSILYEVEVAKQRADRVPSAKRKLDVPSRKCEMSNGMNNSDNNNYTNQSIKADNNNGFDRLSLPSDNPSWRRTHSDSALHQCMMPSVAPHYHAQHNNDDNNQQLNYTMNDNKLDPPPYNAHHQNSHLQISNTQFQPQHNYDLNNNNNYVNDRTNYFYSTIPQQNIGSATTHTPHTLLGPRYSSGNNNSNVLMLPPNQNLRNGGSLPDLRAGSLYNNNQQLSFSTVQSPPTSTSQHCFRSSPPPQNNTEDFFMLEPRQQLPSSAGPLKQSPSIRRRHSPIGEVRQPSSRRHSPSPDVCSTQQTGHLVEPQSPQSQSSYSPQNSPNLLSPGNEHSPFSPPQQQQQQQSTDNQQHYFTLATHFDQINLDNNFYNQQSSPPTPQQNQHHSLPATPNAPNNFQPRNFYPPFIDEIPSTYYHNQTANLNVKSPTIPNIILTDVDSSKLDLSKELANDFPNPFDGLIDTTDLQLNTDDFLLNAADLSVDPSICDDTFRMER